MSHATEHIASTLKTAREAKGLSQRALGEKAGVPQSHISKIENGAVDLRVSSLVELGRALDLELMLLPRKAVSAVQSIVRAGTDGPLATDEPARRALKELKRLQDSIAHLGQLHPTVNELAQLQRQVRELQHFPIPREDFETIRGAAAVVKDFQLDAASLKAIRDSLSQLRNLRNALAHGRWGSADSESVRPAYGFDEDYHG